MPVKEATCNILNYKIFLMFDYDSINVQWDKGKENPYKNELFSRRSWGNDCGIMIEFN